MATTEDLLKRAAGATFLLLGGVVLLLGASLLAFGLGGAIVGMHGGLVSAGVTAMLGVGPAYLGYSLLRKGLRLVRGTDKGHATSLST